MAKNINEYREKLIDKIVHADSHQAVNRYIDTAIQTLKRKKVHGHLIVRFIERSITDVEARQKITGNDTGQQNFKAAALSLRSARSAIAGVLA